MVGIAFVMDLILGDPKGAPHPVRVMGKAARFLERITRKESLVNDPASSGRGIRQRFLFHFIITVPWESYPDSLSSLDCWFVTKSEIWTNREY